MPDTSARRFEYRHLIVPRTARYVVMGSFEAPLSEVWIVCHGHGQLAARFLARFSALEREDRLFVAPEALSRYYLTAPNVAHGPGSPVGATWMTREDRESEITDQALYLDLLHEEIFSRVRRDAVRLWVLGFSQGVATVSRWIAKSNVMADQVVLWTGLVPPDLDSVGARALAKRAPLTMVVGSSDEYATPELIAAQEARLRELGVPFRTIRFDGGHEITDSALEELTRPAER